jgi:hypothetical protein
MQDSDLRYDLVNVLRKIEIRKKVICYSQVPAPGFEPWSSCTNDTHAYPLSHAAAFFVVILLIPVSYLWNHNSKL